jgi:type I restriction enzyme, S subunit
LTHLPQGWAIATLSQLVASGGIFADGDWIESKDQDPDGAIRLLQLADIGDGVFVDKSNRFINEATFDRLRCTEVLPGDVLIARMPDPLGRACLAPASEQKRITVVDVAIVRPRPDSVIPTWLMHVINAPKVREVIELESSGTTRRRIARGKLAVLSLPVPPLDEQQRIAEKVGSLRAKASSCRERLERVPQILKKFRDAVLEAAVSGRLTEEWRGKRLLDWELVPVSDAGEVQLGRQRSPKDHSGPHMRPYLRVANVYEDRLNLSDVKEMNFSPAEYDVFRLLPNDILLNEGQSKELVGRPAMYRGEMPGACFQNTLIRFRASDRVHPSFALTVFRHYLHSGAFQRVCKWTTNIAHLGTNRFAEMKFPVPTLEEQGEVVRRVDTLLAFANSLERKYQTAAASVETLMSSVLAKAFRGELVPQDPNDEPAEEMLERMRQGRVRVAVASESRGRNRRNPGRFRTGVV